MKIYYIKWHTTSISVQYFICAANSEGHRDMIFKKFCEDNDIHLGAYSPRVLEIPEGEGRMLPFN
jgi:hypothetical protein